MISCLRFIPSLSLIHHIARDIFVQQISDHVSPCHITQSDGSPSLQYMIKTPSTPEQCASHQSFQFNLLLPPSMQPILNPYTSLAFPNSLCFSLASALYMPASPSSQCLIYPSRLISSNASSKKFLWNTTTLTTHNSMCVCMMCLCTYMYACTYT